MTVYAEFVWCCPTLNSAKMGITSPNFYARQQERLSHRNSVRLSVCPSVCHTGGSGKNGEG